MKNLPFLVLLFLLCFSNFSFAQKMCNSELDLEKLQKTDPKSYERYVEFNKLVEQSKGGNNERIIDPNGTIIIPVVFHLLYDGTTH